MLNMSILLAILVFAALTVAALVISKLFDDPVTWAIARLLGGIWPRRSVGVKGTWRSTYDYSTPSGRVHSEQIVHIRQFGPYVTGRAILTNGDHLHRIRARLRDRVLTGVWENMTEGAQHYGALQLLLRTDGNIMIGQWVGFDRRNRVQHGEWTWELLSRQLTPPTGVSLMSPPRSTPNP